MSTATTIPTTSGAGAAPTARSRTSGTSYAPSGLPGTSVAPQDATLTTPWRCSNTLCSTGQTWYDRKAFGRKVCSNLFGRNKRETRLIPDDVWHWACRKDYQRATYRARGGTDAAAAADKGVVRFHLQNAREQVLRLRLWRPQATFTIQLEAGARARLARYHDVLRRNGGDTAAARQELRVEPKLRKTQKPGAGEQHVAPAARDAVDFIHAEHIDGVLAGGAKSYADLNAALDWIEQHVEADTMLLVPPIEFLVADSVAGEVVRDPASNFDRWHQAKEAGRRLHSHQALLMQQQQQHHHQLEQQQLQFQQQLRASSPGIKIEPGLSPSGLAPRRRPRVVKIHGPRGPPPPSSSSSSSEGQRGRKRGRDVVYSETDIVPSIEPPDLTYRSPGPNPKRPRYRVLVPSESSSSSESATPPPSGRWYPGKPVTEEDVNAFRSLLQIGADPPAAAAPAPAGQLEKWSPSKPATQSDVSAFHDIFRIGAETESSNLRPAFPSGTPTASNTTTTTSFTTTTQAQEPAGPRPRLRLRVRPRAAAQNTSGAGVEAYQPPSPAAIAAANTLVAISAAHLPKAGAQQPETAGSRAQSAKPKPKIMLKLKRKLSTTTTAATARQVPMTQGDNAEEPAADEAGPVLRRSSRVRKRKVPFDEIQEAAAAATKRARRG